MIKKLSIPLVVVISLILGFTGGLLYSEESKNNSATIQQLINQNTGQVENVDFSLFWKVWNELSSKYVDKTKLDTQKMVYGAIEGMVNAVGDPYTVFFEPETSKKFEEEISGSFGGVGMEIGIKDNILTVIAPLPDTPAAHAGIQAGDKILKIDDTVTDGLSTEAAVTLIRGKPGTKVIIVLSGNDGNPRELTITRAIIKVPTVVWKMLEHDGKKIAYLQIFTFNQNVDSAFAKAAEEIKKANPYGLIVDLRNNPGGLLDSSINLAGFMLEKDKPVVAEIFGNGEKNVFRTSGNSSLLKYQTVLLVNGGSASASEILAGALHDNRGIKLIGEKTYGKGSVQELEKFSDSSSLKVTIANWYTPGGINISAKGIEPDIKVELNEDQKKEIIFGDSSKDPQLQKALEVITQ